MPDFILDFYESISFIDLIYIVLTILSLIKCYKNGFVLSILSMAKWLLAYVLTLLLFPKAKPYLKNIIDNEYILDVGLGITLFVIMIFLILMINKGLSRAIRYTGIGSLDTVFGFPEVHFSILPQSNDISKSPALTEDAITANNNAVNIVFTLIVSSLFKVQL